MSPLRDTTAEGKSVALAGGAAVRKADAAGNARQPTRGEVVTVVCVGSIGKPAPVSAATQAAIARLVAAITPAVISRLS